MASADVTPSVAPATSAVATTRKVQVSASGKALITGGYLILKQPHSGLVVATTSRFYTTAQWGQTEKRPSASTLNVDPSTAAAAAAAESTDSSSVSIPVVVVSPQFRSTTRFLLTLNPARPDAASVCVTVEQLDLAEGEEPNLYILSPIKLACRALAVLEPQHFEHVVMAAAAGGMELTCTLQADNDFYSQREVLLERGLPLTAVAELPNFLPYRGSKTGLGSSAALVSSLTGAVLATFADASGPFADFSGPVAASKGKTLAFVVAQLAHAEAQHSIGSGFDIASAVVGSCRYVRFSPERLAGVFKEASSDDGVEPLSDAAFRDLILDRWDHEVKEFSLPPRFNLLMGDVSAGSVTTSMSRRVLAWLASGGDEASAHWNLVAATNSRVESAFEAVSALADKHPAAYDRVLDALAVVPAAAWGSMNAAVSEGDDASAAAEILAALIELHSGLQKVREVMRRMGELAGPPIEPPEQSKLCDASAALPGVLTCACPGAGGYDAVYALVISDRPSAQGETLKGGSPSDALRALWARWEAPAETPDLGRITPLALTADNNMGLRCEWIHEE